MKKSIESIRRFLEFYPDNGTKPSEEVTATAATANHWAGILGRESARWQSACDTAKAGPKILIANAYGIEPSAANVESMLALALTLRGARVHILVCDEALPACWISQIADLEPAAFVKDGPSRRYCKRCFHGASQVFQSLGLSLHRYSELILPEEFQTAHGLSRNLSVGEIKEYRLDDLEVGEHALSGALRYYARGDFEGEPHGEAVLRRYFNAALLTVFAIRRLMNKYSFTCVSTLHGIYVPEGLIGEVARQQNVRVADWTFSYRKRTFIFSHNDTYHRTLLTEPVATWENLTWTPEMEAVILDYLNSRRYGTRDWVRFIENPEENIAAIAAELGVDFSKPCVGLLTNVVWDAKLSYRNTAFSDMVEWLIQTIQYFSNRTDLQLIIRVHPGEVVGDTLACQTALGEIRRIFPALPKNVFIIPPESAISTYSVMAQCNAAIIYGTKTGVELTSMEIPVIVAGEAWIRNKGITLDASSSEEYFSILDRLPLACRLSKEETQRARKYAYHFFFRRMIPLPFTAPLPGSLPEPDVHGLDDLLPGRNVGLDVICSAILNGSDFVYPAELQPLTLDDQTHVPEKTRARNGLRVADWLGRIGELQRMRAHLLKVLRQYPWLAAEPSVQSFLASIMGRLVTESDQPIAEIRAIFKDVTALTAEGNHKSLPCRLSADVWRELAIASLKGGSYGLAGYATLQAIYRDPSQLVQPTLWKRLIGSVSTAPREQL
jgi:hypothetical protein